MNDNLLRCESLAAWFGGREIFNSISLSLGVGAYALRGPNGIGKSTLLGVIAGSSKAYGGTVRIAGKDLAREGLAARRRLSYVPDRSYAYPFMTGFGLLDFVSSAKKAPITDQLNQAIRDFSLEHQMGVRFDAMSLGTQKKVMISAALIGDPAVIIMDEPTNGVDVELRLHLETLVRTWADQSVVLVTTHDDDFAAAIAATPIAMKDLMQARRSS